MNLSTECLEAAQVDLLLQGNLTPPEYATAQEHLEDCEQCRARVEENIGPEQWWGDVQSVLLNSRSALFAKGPASSADADPNETPTAKLLDLLGPTDDPHMLGRISSYEIVGLLGQGGMGAVFKGFDRSLNRFVAIKMLLPHLAASGAARKRFAREAQAVAAVVDDHVMAIHCIDEWQGVPYLVMTYSRGVSLQKRLCDNGPLEVREILRIGMQAAKGLAAAHAQGIVHRDIKPANIFLDQNVERVQLMDFGLARAVDDASLTRSGTLAGTPQYMSPEQARAEAVDHRSDLFSLGSVLYAMCTGHAPFRAESSYSVLRLITDKEPRPIREINPDIPEWLERIVMKLLSKSPADRFQSTDEVAELLECCIAHVQNPTTTPLPESVEQSFPSHFTWRSAMENRTTKIIALLVSCCVLLVVSLVAFKWHSYQRDQLALTEVGKLGGTYTLESAALIRDTGSSPSSFSRTRFAVLTQIAGANPITEVDLSITSWPREEETFPLMTDNDIKVIASLSRLQRLSLRGMPITDAVVNQLARFQNLKHLDVRETQISTQGLARLKAALPSCEVVAGDAGAAERVSDTLDSPLQIDDIPNGPDQPLLSKTLRQLQGQWRLTHQIAADGDESITPTNAIWEFKGDRIIVRDGGPGGSMMIQVEDKLIPMHVDVSLETDDESGLGLLSIEGDKLVLCLGESQKTPEPESRPKKLQWVSGVWYMELQRVKPGESIAPMKPDSPIQPRAKETSVLNSSTATPPKIEVKESKLLAIDHGNARSVVEAYVALALAGDVAQAAALAKNAPADPKQIAEIPGFLNVQRLKIPTVYVNDPAKPTRALATSEAVKLDEDHKQPDGQRDGFMVFTLELIDDHWLVIDLDIESESGADQELSRFLKANPDAIGFPPVSQGE